MNQRQKEILQSQLNNEKRILNELKQVYMQALKDCEKKIADLSSRRDMENLQSIIYQKRYQQALRGQIEGVLEQLHSDEYATVSDYLARCYDDGFVGTMYDLHGQGIPIILPIDQEQVVKAVQTDSKLSKPLYNRLGEDVDRLKRSVRAEVSRGIATGMTWNEIAVKISRSFTHTSFSKAYNRAMTIARTEGHRIAVEAANNAQYKAKEKGADVLKQWDATLDTRTRDSHRMVDGEIRELDEKFSNGLMYPGDPSGGAAEVCNCRCALLQRARWELDEDELNTLKERAEFFELDKSKDFEDFKNKYLKAQESERVRGSAQKMNDNVEQRLIRKGVYVDIKEAGKYEKEAIQNLNHLDKLLDEYKSTTVSYTVTNKGLIGTENGSAYMLNGKTSISVRSRAYKKIKTTDQLGLGDNQHLGVTYHEFAHSLSQSREKTDPEFWKEIRKIKKEYEGIHGHGDWFDIKISDYASKDADEFLAEAFAQAKLSENPSPYAKKVLDVVDKYFKKEPLENTAKDSKIDLNLQFFAKSSKDYETVVLPKDEYAHVMSELNTHLSDEQRKQKVVTKAIGNYNYTIENNGFDNYRIIGKEDIDSDALDWWDK